MLAFYWLVSGYACGPDQPKLTPLGDVVQIGVRIIVPVLLGLAALSVRGRVKR